MKWFWQKSMIRFAVGALVVLGLSAGCGAKSEESAATAEPTRNQIQRIELEQVDGTVNMRIVGTMEPDAKVFKLTDPVRLIVDMANSDVSAVEIPPVADVPAVTGIEATTTPTGIGRFIIELAENVPYETQTQQTTLVVQIMTGAPAGEEAEAYAAGEEEAPAEEPEAAAGAAPAEEDPFAEEGFGEGEFEEFDEEFSFEFEEEAAPADEAAAGAVAAVEDEQVLEPATALTGIRTEPVGETVNVILEANGRIPGHDSFTLEDPQRLVVDVLNVTNETGSREIPAPAGRINRIEINQLPDRVRVIVEHGFDALEYSFTAEGDVLTANLRAPGMMVAESAEPAPAEEEFLFEEEPAQQPAEEEPAPAAEEEDLFLFEEPAGMEPAEPEAEMAEETAEAGTMAAGGAAAVEEEAAYPVAAPGDMAEEAVRVTSIDFIPGEETTSVKVAYEGELTTEVIDTAEKEVTIRLLNATLVEGLVRALDTSRFVGPVTMVKSFVESTPSGEQGRVVINLRQRVVYEVRREPGALYVEFPTKPAKAPAVAEAPEEAAPAATEIEVAEFEEFDYGEAAAAAPAPGVAAPAPGFPGETGAQQYQGRRISLEFREADIRDVLQLIAEVSRLNIIASDDVAGTVTLSLRNVPWDQALDIILETQNLGKKVVGNVVRIAPREILAAEERERLEVQIADRELQPLSFQIVPVNYANAGELQPRIEEILTDRGTVTVDERTNSLLIQDLPAAIERAVETVRALDTQTGQVLIEARIVTTTLDFTREFGIQWGGRFLSSPTVGNNLGNNVIQNNFLVDLPVTAIGQRAGSAAGFSFGTLNDAFNLDVILSAFEESGQGRLVASPRISVLDKQEASIETGISVPITTVQGGTISTQLVDAVLGVEVVPQITSDNAVILDLAVFDNTINVAIPTAFGNPAINKNEAETQLLVRDGHTVVIGGIVQTQEGFNEIAVPYFNKIPFLGYFFRTREYTDERNELLIFMTPQIVRE